MSYLMLRNKTFEMSNCPCLKNGRTSPAQKYNKVLVLGNTEKCSIWEILSAIYSFKC